MKTALRCAATLMMLAGMPCAAQGFPFPTTPTRTKTRTPTPTFTPTRTGATQTPTVTPTPRPAWSATPTPTPAGSLPCYTPWPTPSPNVPIITLLYRWSGHGACFYTVASAGLGPSADVFLRVDGGPPRRVRWAPDCWTYEDGSVPYALPQVNTGPVTFSWELRLNGQTERTGVRFDPPSHVRE